MNNGFEEKLVSRCRNGDKSAYASLVEAYSGRVFAICLGMLGHSHDAEDVAQQALLKGFTNIEKLRNGEHFGAWLSRIAKNMCIDFVRRKKYKKNGLLEQTLVVESSSNEYPELQEALAKLPEQYRLALVLYYFEERDGKAIAETLDISQNAVYARISRARKQLRELLEALGGKK